MKYKAICLLITSVLLVTSGCVRYTYSLVKVKPDFQPAGNQMIAVASHDQRDYVVSGKNKPQSVGVIRAAFGNPVYMYTGSGLPLAQEMGDVIADALNKKGFKTTKISVAATDPAMQVQKKLMDTGAEKLIYFQLNQWKNDTYNRIRLEYAIKLSVMDQKGTVLAQKEVSGDDNLGGAGMNTLTGTRRKVPPAFKEKIEALFNAPEIVKALQN